MQYLHLLIVSIYPSLHNPVIQYCEIPPCSSWYFRFYKIPEWLRLDGTSGDPPVPPFATAGWPGPCLVVFWVSPSIETPQPPQPACLITGHPRCRKSVFLHLNGIFCFFVCAHCLLSCYRHQSRPWLHLLYCPHQVFTQMGKVPLSLFLSRLNSHSSLSLSL